MKAIILRLMLVSALVCPAYASAADLQFHPSKHFGLGYSTYLLNSATSGVTGWLDLSSTDARQLLFGIGSTSPFTFGAGALYKHTVNGNASTGFHIGGGLTLGTSAGGGGGNLTLAQILAGNVNAGGGTSFAMGFAGIAGFHFPFPGSPNVLLNIDGGPLFTLVGSSGSFALGPLSGILGASILYMF